MKRPLLTFAMALLFAGLVSPLHAEFKPEVKFAQVGDVKLAYYIRGEGEPLLMINGFLSTLSLWDPALIEELAKEHQLILFDWLAFFEGGHSFLFQSHKQFAATVNVFLQ